MTERKTSCRGAAFVLVLAAVAICAFICGCTATGGTMTDEGATTTAGEISENPIPQNETQRGPPGNRTAGGGFDLASAAEKLGVTEDTLKAALGGGAEGERMDFEAAAEELGVTVEELQTALGGPMGGQMPQDGQAPPNGTPPAPPPG